MAKKKKKRWFNRLTPEQKDAYVAKIVAGKAIDPRRKTKVDAQAVVLIAERIAMFGSRWRENCSINIPKDFKDPYAEPADEFF